jgi:hypothetical protein
MNPTAYESPVRRLTLHGDVLDAKIALLTHEGADMMALYRPETGMAL